MLYLSSGFVVGMAVSYTSLGGSGSNRGHTHISADQEAGRGGGGGDELRPEAELDHYPQSPPFQTNVSQLDSTASLNSATSWGPTVHMNLW